MVGIARHHGQIVDQRRGGNPEEDNVVPNGVFKEFAYVRIGFLALTRFADDIGFPPKTQSVSAIHLLSCEVRVVADIGQRC